MCENFKIAPHTVPVTVRYGFSPGDAAAYQWGIALWSPDSQGHGKYLPRILAFSAIIISATNDGPATATDTFGEFSRIPRELGERLQRTGTFAEAFSAVRTEPAKTVLGVWSEGDAGERVMSASGDDMNLATPLATTGRGTDRPHDWYAFVCRVPIVDAGDYTPALCLEVAYQCQR